MESTQQAKRRPNVRAFDDDGNEVQVVIHNTICPAQHVERARQMCWDYMQSLGNEDRLDQMLADPLSPTGELPATHYICTARMLEHQGKHAQRTERTTETRGYGEQYRECQPLQKNENGFIKMGVTGRSVSSVTTYKKG